MGGPVLPHCAAQDRETANFALPQGLLAIACHFISPCRVVYVQRAVWERMSVNA